MNFLITHACKIRSDDFIDQITLPMYYYEKKTKQKKKKKNMADRDC